MFPTGQAAAPEDFYRQVSTLLGIFHLPITPQRLMEDGVLAADGSVLFARYNNGSVEWVKRAPDGRELVAAVRGRAEYTLDDFLDDARRTHVAVHSLV